MELESSTSATLRFSRSAMASLSFEDQQTFERFGQGPLVELPRSCIHHAIEAQALAQPDAIAAQHLGQVISYAMLDRQANRLAHLLAQHGVVTGDRVALFVHRSIPMVVGILAVLKAGASYVPQHVGVAKEPQLRHVVKVSSARVVLTLSHLRSQVPVPPGGVCLAIDELMAEPFDGQATPRFTPRLPVSGADGCFTLFTSGTTGMPNGVQVTHHNVCNILLTEPGRLGMRPGLKVSHILAIAFDMAAWEILGCLAHGATLVIRGASIAEAVQQADIVIATPTILSELDADACRNVRVVAVAGEPCPKPLADKWASFCTFYNSCGPTETTIVNTAQHYLPDGRPLTIGKPTPNNTVYVLDEHRRPCPIGEIGEMWAGGACVSAGYLHNDALNAERYAADPFLGHGHRMFRTRDLGRWTEDGELEHFGRVDDQVKVRGFRVELDSVSSVLEQAPQCERAVTLKFDERGLVAFVAPQSVDATAARELVAATLPYYCVPMVVFALDSLPMTDRGKVDKRRLMALAQESGLIEPHRAGHPISANPAGMAAATHGVTA
ncbi:MAG TPA: amino acid adenylation domain-containing protein [Ideonella sp.]|uniref:amino acid adenylation domain-containing protein n=1 Tax=Ideonella sp. TaxID=1929293 RepID=UPI002E34F9D5|nr:amino acid adenylation domain-containing protein [Ideonella sp.]HEX5686276.1 amino acid adenylation domain-containing protein [Ideonella sp.]